MWDSKNLGGSYRRQIVNPDLEEERKKCTFDQQEMARFVYSEPIYNYVQEIDQFLKANPELTENSLDYYDMSREEKFTSEWKKNLRVMQLKPEIFLNNDKAVMWKWHFAFSSTPNPLHLH